MMCIDALLQVMTMFSTNNLPRTLAAAEADGWLVLGKLITARLSFSAVLHRCMHYGGAYLFESAAAMSRGRGVRRWQVAPVLM